MKKSYALLVACTALIVLGADQLSKQAILDTFQPGELRPVIDGLFNLTLTFNRGAAFGLWSDLPPGWREMVLATTILIAICVVGFLLTRSYYRNAISQMALAAVLGGAVGNVIDRFRFGAVVDFLDFYVGASHWPAFNVADSAICVGVAVLVLFPTKDAPPKNG